MLFIEEVFLQKHCFFFSCNKKYLILREVSFLLSTLLACLYSP